MANERNKVAITFGALGITFVNAVPLGSVFWLWFIAMSWAPTQRLTIIPIKGRICMAGKILLYGPF